MQSYPMWGLFRKRRQDAVLKQALNKYWSRKGIFQKDGTFGEISSQVMVWVGGLDSCDPLMKGIVTWGHP